MKHPVKIVFLAMDAGDKYLIQNWARMNITNHAFASCQGTCWGNKMWKVGEGSNGHPLYRRTPARHGFHRLTQINPELMNFIDAILVNLSTGVL
jgi:hypothetical protein